MLLSVHIHGLPNSDFSTSLRKLRHEDEKIKKLTAMKQSHPSRKKALHRQYVPPYLYPLSSYLSISLSVALSIYLPNYLSLYLSCLHIEKIYTYIKI